MIYISLGFYVFLFIVVLLYYSFPLKRRWYVLMFASIFFYTYFLVTFSIWSIVLFLLLAILSYVIGRVLAEKKKAYLLILGIIVTLIPLLIVKYSSYFTSVLRLESKAPSVVMVGISFYTLQIIAYLVDSYKGKMEPQKNILKYDFNENSLYNEIEYEFATDNAEISHANINGAIKITSYIGKVLKEKYYIESHYDEQ